MSEFREGDILRYQPDPDRHDRWWCREGMAYVVSTDPLRIADTYWRATGDGESHQLTQTEALTAAVIFNINDYDEVRDKWRWAEYAPADRAFIQSQHNLQHVWYVRKGAVPDAGQKVRNAQEAFHEAVDKATSAARSLEWTKRELDRLVNEALIETDDQQAVGDRAVPA